MFLLILLGKAIQEKDKFRDLNFQVKLYINDLKASVCVLKENFVSYH